MSNIIYPDELNNRVHFKLNAARRHLDNLIRLEDRAGSLAQDDIRVQAEMDIDECLYHLVGVKDALLQEINNELHLALRQRDVNLETINKELSQRGGANARGITKEIDDMASNDHNPLWLVNELHNRSEHRNLIGQDIAIVNGRPARASLIDPRTGQGMRADDGTRILVIFYLEESYTAIEDLQRTVREKIRKYRNSTGT